jgi:hypothetical protein
MANYAQAMEMAKNLLRSGGLPPGTTLGMMAQQIMGGAEAMPERGGMPPMTTGLLESVRAGVEPPVQADPIAAETAARQARAAQAGGVSPEMEALYAAREARLGKEEERIGKDEKRAAWDALAQMGFKMAQTTSPYFATALAEGMQAGTTGYNAAKIEAAERKAKVLDGKENVALARLEERQKRIDANEAAFRGDVEMAGKTAGLSKDAAEAAMKQIELEFAPVLAQLSVEEARGKIADRAAELGLTKAQTNKVLQDIALEPRRVAAYEAGQRRSGQSDDAMTENQRRQAQDNARQRLNDAKKTMFDAKRAYETYKDPLDMIVWRDATEEYKAAESEFKSMAGGRGASTAAKGYDFTYVPGKGVMPAR